MRCLFSSLFYFFKGHHSLLVQAIKDDLTQDVHGESNHSGFLPFIQEGHIHMLIDERDYPLPFLLSHLGSGEDVFREYDGFLHYLCAILHVGLLFD